MLKNSIYAMRQIDPLKEVLTEIDAAEIVGVCTRTLRRLRQQDKIPFSMIERQVRYLRSDLMRWLASGGTAQKGN